MDGKTVSASRFITQYQTLPADANNEGHLFGGRLLSLLDTTAYLSAARHARSLMVTANVDVAFRAPIRVGDILILYSSVNAAMRSSMEVGIRVETENPLTGERQHACTAFLTFVVVDENGRPGHVPRLITENEEDERRMADAARRMALARLEPHRDKALMSGLHLELLPGCYAVCRFPKTCPMPDLSAMPATAFASLTVSETEVSVVLDDVTAQKMESTLPDMKRAGGYRCMRVMEQDSREKVGLLASLTALMASSLVPVLTISSYNTVYVLVEAGHVGTVTAKLRSAGHSVIELPCDCDERK
ncbi:ACT domain-containing protein [Desulfovibrio sp. OttesenSCG-928-G15]|nr:ACT domain-containing protein [Desulfovibrio sp. OttesenSCG-928-G15]